MHSRRDDDGFTHSNVDRIAREVGDDEHVDVVAGEGLAEDGLADLVFVGEGADFVDEVTLVRVRVRVAVGEKHRVVVVYLKQRYNYSNLARVQDIDQEVSNGLG